MREELVPTAEDRANYGKVVKQSIRGMWVLEYEISDIQKDFATSIGNVDINNLTDDFVEDVMLQSKPLQGILSAIRKRQKVINTLSFRSSDHDVTLSKSQAMTTSLF